MIERISGWYWVKHKRCEDWEPDYWDGGDWACADIGSHDELGPRIPTPDELWESSPAEAEMWDADDERSPESIRDTLTALAWKS